MEIVIYSPFEKVKQDMLQKDIYRNVKHYPTMVSDFEELGKVLKQKISGHVLIIFFISSIKEFEFLQMNNGLLFNSRYLFILLNGNDEMVSKGLSLYPRYIAHMNHDFKNISAVVKRIIQTDKLYKKYP